MCSIASLTNRRRICCDVAWRQCMHDKWLRLRVPQSCIETVLIIEMVLLGCFQVTCCLCRPGAPTTWKTSPTPWLSPATTWTRRTSTRRSRLSETRRVCATARRCNIMSLQYPADAALFARSHTIFASTKTDENIVYSRIPSFLWEGRFVTSLATDIFFKI